MNGKRSKVHKRKWCEYLGVVEGGRQVYDRHEKCTMGRAVGSLIGGEARVSTGVEKNQPPQVQFQEDSPEHSPANAIKGSNAVAFTHKVKRSRKSVGWEDM